MTECGANKQYLIINSIQYTVNKYLYRDLLIFPFIYSLTEEVFLLPIMGCLKLSAPSHPPSLLGPPDQTPLSNCSWRCAEGGWEWDLLYRVKPGENACHCLLCFPFPLSLSSPSSVSLLLFEDQVSRGWVCV